MILTYTHSLTHSHTLTQSHSTHTHSLTHTHTHSAMLHETSPHIIVVMIYIFTPGVSNVHPGLYITPRVTPGVSNVQPGLDITPGSLVAVNPAAVVFCGSILVSALTTPTGSRTVTFAAAPPPRGAGACRCRQWVCH